MGNETYCSSGLSIISLQHFKIKILQRDNITHLLVLPAVHHSRHVIPKHYKKAISFPSSPSKSLLSPNPFACLALSNIDPPLHPHLPPVDPSLTTPAVGSLYSARESPNLFFFNMLDNIFFWNVRGINESVKQSTFRRWPF